MRKTSGIYLFCAYLNCPTIHFGFAAKGIGFVKLQNLHDALGDKI
jgi:hypothetical protein